MHTCAFYTLSLSTSQILSNSFTVSPSLMYLWRNIKQIVLTITNSYCSSYYVCITIFSVLFSYHPFICISANPSPMSAKRNGITFPLNAVMG